MYNLNLNFLLNFLIKIKLIIESKFYLLQEAQYVQEIISRAKLVRNEEIRMEKFNRRDLKFFETSTHSLPESPTNFSNDYRYLTRKFKQNEGRLNKIHPN
jgi:hypothetical protein